MKKSGTIEMIDSLQGTLRAQIERLGHLRSVDEQFLVTRPSADRWSVIEVAEHINITSGHYFDRLKKAYADPRSGLKMKPFYKPGYFGEMSVKAMQPQSDGKINWKMKTLGMFEPRKAPSKGVKALDELDRLLHGMIDLLEVARKRGIEGVKITSTLGPVLRFKAGDAFRFPIAHQERHFLQMERTLAAVRSKNVGAARSNDQGRQHFAAQLQ